jgi:hypothetical protein
MSFTPHSQVRTVHGIDEKQKTHIYAFLQGAVYCWCKNRPQEWFSLRDLMGGENYYWQGTPLMPLYEKHEAAADAVERAGKDGGWLLKHVIDIDLRKFETKKAKLIRQYRWVSKVEQ